MVYGVSDVYEKHKKKFEEEFILAHDNPEWVIPDVTEGAAFF